MSNARGGVVLVILGIAVLVPTTAAAQNNSPTARRWIQGSWSTDGGLTLPSEQLRRGELTAVHGQTIYVFDYSDHVLTAFTMRGEPIWRFGHQGMEQGGFSSPTDLEVDSRGRIWICDPLVGRVTIVDQSGRMVRTIDGMTYLWHVIPRSDGRFWGLMVVRAGNDLRNSVRLYDASGVHFKEISLSADLRNVSTVVASARLTATPDDGVVVTYLWSDRFVVVDGKSLAVHEYRGLEHREFPTFTTQPTALHVGAQTVSKVRIDTAAVPAALAASVNGDSLYVLFGSGPRETPGTRRIVDVYRVDNGKYVGSYRLPEDVNHVLVHEGQFVGSLEQPEGAIRVWTWMPKR